MLAKRVYYIKNGKLKSRIVKGFTEDIKEFLADTGLYIMRQTVRSDFKSPIMVVVK